MAAPIGLILWLTASISLLSAQNVDTPSGSAPIKTISGGNLDTLIKSTKFVLIYLTSDGCEMCVKNLPVIEQVLKSAKVEGLAAVGVNDASIAARYDVKAYPSIVFFRKALPLVYSGEMEMDEIRSWLEQNTEISTRILNEDSFEHLTQASTGATTGDWFVLFYRPECKDLLATWEAIAYRLKGRLNVARVNVEKNVKLGKRFKIVQCPTITLFRLGKMYRYTLDKKDAISLINFAEGWYKNMKAEVVSVPQSPFDEVVENLVEQLKFHLQGPRGVLYLSAFACISVVAFIITAACCVHGVKSKQE